MPTQRNAYAKNDNFAYVKAQSTYYYSSKGQDLGKSWQKKGNSRGAWCNGMKKTLPKEVPTATVGYTRQLKIPFTGSGLKAESFSGTSKNL